MLWKHEEPLEDEAVDGPVRVLAKPLRNGSHEVGEAPIRCNYGCRSAVESNHGQASGLASIRPGWRMATPRERRGMGGRILQEEKGSLLEERY